ncbi:MAG: class I SAM-dependent methyltransferase [Arachnia sp.]
MGTDSSAAGDDPEDLTQLVQRAASDWLALRRPADETARSLTCPALALLDTHLASRLGAREAVTVLDLGAGTGANMAWLAPRLTVPQRWVLVDRDEDLLHLAALDRPPATVLAVHRVAAELDDLHRDGVAGSRPDLVTCSAFLDVLTLRQVRELAAFVVSTGAAALLSLTVTGVVRLHPEAELDFRIEEEFNAHQRRVGLAGPGATALAAQALRDGGRMVEMIDTPWVLGSDEAPLLERYLSDRVAAVIEHDPALSGEAEQWLGLRLSQLRDRALSVEVGHADLMALPS